MPVTRTVVALGIAFIVAAPACSRSVTSPTSIGDRAPLSPTGSFSHAGPSVLLQVPGDSPGPPYYAISANGGFIPTDGVWAAIPFLRELGCVPAAQDLLAFAIPAAFACALTIHGHEHWQNGPGIDVAPRQTQFTGLGAVPIVFARWSDVQPATAGGLTFAELLGLPSAIVGTAGAYHETDVLGISGPLGAGRGSYKITARGTLADSRPFSLHVNEVLGNQRVVQIRFGAN